MAKKNRGFDRKDFPVTTRPDPIATLEKYKHRPLDSPLNSSLNFDICTDFPKNLGKNINLCSIRYTRYSIDNTPETILCHLAVNEAYVHDKEKNNLVAEFCKDIELLTELITLQHTQAKEILFCSQKNKATEFIQIGLQMLAKQKGTSVKTKICELHQAGFDDRVQQNVATKTKRVGFALQLYSPII